MYYTNKWGELTNIPNIPMAGDDTSAQNLRQAQAEKITNPDYDPEKDYQLAREREANKVKAAADQAAAAQRAADAQYLLALKRKEGYAKGGPVIKGEFKHAHPTYAAYAKSGDGSLLAKGRK